jgi:DNA-formamidopyrimidine glycosylase
MPEGAEVHTVADRLHQKISGKWIWDIKVNQKSRYFKSGLDKLDKIHFPIFISCINAKGKKIIFECLTSVGRKKLYLVSALAMTGRWQYVPGNHSGIEFKFEDGSFVYFDDQRHFGALIICLNKAELKETMKEVGPDLLIEDISFEDYNEVISNQKIKTKQICGFLLEQKHFSGVGNWVRAEVLYESRIAPHRTLESLSLEDKYRIYFYSIKILRDAYKVRGLTITNYIDPEGEFGEYPVKVYFQEKDPFGNEVSRSVLNVTRTIHWVPKLQV